MPHSLGPCSGVPKKLTFFETSTQSTVGKRSRNKKNSCLRIKIPRSSKKDPIQGLSHCSPMVAAEEELVKRVDVVEVVEADLPRTVPRSIPRTDLLEEEEAPRRRIKVMIPLPVATHPIEAI